MVHLRHLMLDRPTKCLTDDTSLTTGRRACRVTVQGLYPFIIPFLDDYVTPGEFQAKTLYKRLRVALPHGRSEGTTPMVFGQQVELFRRQGKAAPQAVEYRATFIDRCVTAVCWRVC